MTSGLAITRRSGHRVPSMLAIRDLRRRVRVGADRLASLERLSAVLALDPASACRALALRIARVHGRGSQVPRSIEELARACGRAGLRRLLDVQELEPDGTQQLRVLWLHAIATACAARRLARATGVLDPDHAYLAGLLHDVETWTDAALGPGQANAVAAALRGGIELPPPRTRDAEESSDADDALARPPEEIVREHPQALIAIAESLACLADLGHREELGSRASRIARLAATSHEALVTAHEVRHDVEQALAEFGLGSSSDCESPPESDEPKVLFARPARPMQTDMVLALLQCKRASSYQAITTLATAAAIRFLDFDRGFYVSWHPSVDRCFVRTKTDLLHVPLVREPVIPDAHERATLESVIRDGAPRIVEASATTGGLAAWLGSGEVLIAPLDRGSRSSSFLVLDRTTSARPLDPTLDVREVAALAGFVTLLIDNFRLRLHRLRARRDASIDPLTRLANRGFGMLTLEQHVARARRSASPLCVLMVDLDEFKALNDRLGHLAGDQALRVAAQVLRRNVRRADTVCRYGGEEFLVVLPDTGPQEASLLAARLFVAIEEQSSAEGLPVTASIGLASLRHGEDDVESLLDRADRALYASKVHGRNRFSVDIE